MKERREEGGRGRRDGRGEKGRKMIERDEGEKGGGKERKGREKGGGRERKKRRENEGKGRETWEGWRETWEGWREMWEGREDEGKGRKRDGGIQQMYVMCMLCSQFHILPKVVIHFAGKPPTTKLPVDVH